MHIEAMTFLVVIVLASGQDRNPAGMYYVASFHRTQNCNVNRISFTAALTGFVVLLICWRFNRY